MKMLSDWNHDSKISCESIIRLQLKIMKFDWCYEACDLKIVTRLLEGYN